MVYRIRRQCVDKRISKVRSGKLGSEKEKIMRKLWMEKEKAKQKTARHDCDRL